MDASGFDKDTATVSALLSDLFEVQAVYRQRDSLAFSISCRFDRQRSVKLIRDRLKMAGYRFTLTEEEQSLLLVVDPKRRFRIPTVNVVLFTVTLFSVYIVPVFLRNLQAALILIAGRQGSPSGELDLTLAALSPAFKGTLADLGAGVGIEFTLALVSILFVHEMGHFIASRRRGIITSWPYFIPAPNIIGTFGAIIKSKSPFWNRRDLIEVGAAGPIAGWVVALGWLLWGLSRSICLPPEMIISLKQMPFSLQGESIIMRAASLLLVGPAPGGFYYKLTEAAFAGWVGMLVTAINLLPIGQLDGGHILYGLSRRRQFLLGRLAMVALIVLGFQSPMWWFFAAFGLIFGVKHPPTLDDNRRPTSTALTMGIIALVILVLSFTPVPFR